MFSFFDSILGKRSESEASASKTEIIDPKDFAANKLIKVLDP